MKRILLILFAIISNDGFAQDIKVPSSLVVVESTYKLDGAERIGFDIVLQGKEKDIIGEWSRYLKDKFEIKMTTKGTSAKGGGFSNAIWSDKEFSIVSIVAKDASGHHLRVWMMFGPEVFVNSAQYNREAANVKAVMKEFSKAYYVGIFQKELDQQTKAVNSQGKEVTDLSKDKAKDEKAIAKSEASIAKAEKKKAGYQSKIEKYQKSIANADEDIRDARENIKKKKGGRDKTATDLQKEEDKFKSVNADQETIKAKIRAVQAL